MTVWRLKRGIAPKRLNRSLKGDILIWFILLFFGIFMALPLVYAVSSSLKPMDEIFAFPPRFFVKNPTISNFTSLFNTLPDLSIPFTRYFFNTLFVSVVGTGGHVILSSMAAYALCKHEFQGRRLLFEITVLSLMFTTSVTAIPSFFIISKLGLMNNLLALILPAFSSPLGLYLMKQFMEQMVRDDVLEAARIDGSGEVHTFFRIVMPMVKPAWLTLIVFSFQGLWATGSSTLIQREELKTLNYALSQIMASGVARTGTAAAAVVMMMILPAAIFIISQSNIIETMASSGMKD